MIKEIPMFRRVTPIWFFILLSATAWAGGLQEERLAGTWTCVPPGKSDSPSYKSTFTFSTDKKIKSYTDEYIPRETDTPKQGVKTAIYRTTESGTWRLEGNRLETIVRQEKVQRMHDLAKIGTLERRLDDAMFASMKQAVEEQKEIEGMREYIVKKLDVAALHMSEDGKFPIICSKLK